MQLESNVEFNEFLEVYKSKTNKSAWVNDIVLPSSGKRARKTDKSSNDEQRRCDADKQETEAAVPKVEPKKKLTDLQASNSWWWCERVLKGCGDLQEGCEGLVMHVLHCEFCVCCEPFKERYAVAEW